MERTDSGRGTANVGRGHSRAAHITARLVEPDIRYAVPGAPVAVKGISTLRIQNKTHGVARRLEKELDRVIQGFEVEQRGTCITRIILHGLDETRASRTIQGHT